MEMAAVSAVHRRELRSGRGTCGNRKYFGMDPTLVRLAWVLFCALGGSGVIAYLLAAIIIPRRPEGF